MWCLAFVWWLLRGSVPVSGAPLQGVSSQLAAANKNRTILGSQIAPTITAGATYRGTFDILWSCLLTLLACIYSAIHLNVPFPKTSPWRLLVRKMKWAALALFAPEILLYTAAIQFLDARRVVREVNEMRGQVRGKERPKVIDLRYGFYVAMGGFVFDVNDLHDYISRATLTPQGIINLARQGQFLDIGPETINDKSKANIITKGLICIQVIWMLIQCVARKVAGYPLTLLEYHTMVHVVCALMLYVLWWKKPFDIVEPTVIDPSQYAEYAKCVALMIVGSPLSDPFSGLPSWTESQKLVWYAPKIVSNSNSSDDTKTQAVAQDGRKVNKPIVLGQPFDEVLQENASRPENQKDQIHVCTLVLGQFLACGIGPLSQTSLYLSHKDLRRWELASAALMELSQIECLINERCLDGKSCSLSYLLDGTYDDSLRHYIPNFQWDIMDDLTTEGYIGGNVILSTLRYVPTFVPLTAIYAGIHLAAWTVHFPSYIEFLLWTTACFFILGSSLILVTLGVYVRCYAYVYRECRPSSGRTLTAHLEGLWLIAPTLVSLYTASRIYLVAESFLSLRHVPIGVYATVPWVQNVPHV